MSERQTLLLVLALIYLSECVLWVRRGGVLFRRTWFRWSARTESEAVQNDRGDLHWTWPLPPFGDAFVAQGIPFTLGPEGVMNFTATSVHRSGRPLMAPRFFRWEEIKDINISGKILRLNGDEFWRGDTIHEALRLGHMLNALRKTARAGREAAVRERIATAFSRDAIRKRLEEAADVTRSLRSVSIALFAAVFVISPVAIVRFGWLPPLLFIVPGVFVLMGVTAWMTRRAHRRLYPEGGDERFRYVVMISLSPVAGTRATDVVQRAALEGFHPLAVASVLLEAKKFAAFAATAWRDLKYPRLPENALSEAPAVADGRWYAGVLAERYAEILRATGLNPADFEKAPVKTDPSHAKYCPRCHGQFTAVASECRECGGRPLVSFPD
jgi:hypothetical protein